MAYSPRVPPAQLRKFKEAGKGLPQRQAAERILSAVLDYFRAEVTVLDKDGSGELFRIGNGPRHGIDGVHVHPVSIQWGTWQLKAHRTPVEFLSADDFNMYLGTLLQALEIGRYRVGHPRA